MTDLFERELADRLHAHPLPDEIAGLASHSIQRGQRIRRRRIAAAAAVLVLVLMVPATAWTWLRSLDSDAPPVSPTTSASATQWTGPRSVILDLGYRPPGDPPALGIVRGKMILPASGPVVHMPAEQFGTVAEYRSGYAWLTRSGDDISLNFSSRSPLSITARDLTGVEAGPNGSVMIRTKTGPILLDVDGMVTVLDSPPLRTDRVAATADALWVENQGRVVRVDASDLRGGSFAIVEHAEWRKVVVGDPQSDRVVVTDESGCQIVVNGSTSEPVWRTCDWELNTFSPDGRFVAGQHRALSLGVVELASGHWLLAVDTDMNPFGERLALDETGRLSMVLGAPSVGFAVLSCDLEATCVRDPNGPDRIEFVYPNR
jgi:hypothetical protein